MSTASLLQRPVHDSPSRTLTIEVLQIKEDEQSEEFQNHSRKHPLGVKPGGNALTSAHNLQFAMGLFGGFPDSVIMSLLEYLDDKSLISLGSTCRGLFAYTTFDQLWRDIAINESRPSFCWRGSWRASWRRLPSVELPNVDCSCLFSDALYRPFQCSQVPFESFVSNIPKSNHIARFSHLTEKEFSESWAGTPFILTEPVKQWKVFEDWNADTLVKNYASTSFRAEAVDWPLHTYIQYMNANSDESPLYLFDRGFVEKMGLHVGRDGDYEPPTCFGEDLFMLLKDKRPDHRWLIVGPERSGSTFHKDPNATSAWNAVVRGSKYWIMFPNSIIPPGVYMSEDQSEVTSPLSIAEWLLTFHEEARDTPGCIEAICGEGEVLHVPSGWWHLVVNLESAIAITQNFVPKAHARAAVSFLKNKADQVSGFTKDIADPYGLFMEALERRHPDIFAEIQSVTDRKRKWGELVAQDGQHDEREPGFSFGFGHDLEDDEVP